MNAITHCRTRASSGAEDGEGGRQDQRANLGRSRVQQLETDYLVIGSGVMGMAFCDELIAGTNASIIIVDKHHQPGGH